MVNEDMLTSDFLFFSHSCTAVKNEAEILHFHFLLGIIKNFWQSENQNLEDPWRLNFGDHENERPATNDWLI